MVDSLLQDYQNYTLDSDLMFKVDFWNMVLQRLRQQSRLRLDMLELRE
jgi:hypothetical protein